MRAGRTSRRRGRVPSVDRDLDDRAASPARGALLASAVALAVLMACGSADEPAPGPRSAEAERGAALARSYGCASCHPTGTGRGTGPGWGGLAGSEVELSDGTVVIADDAYLRRAVTDPGADVVKGFGALMPRFDLDDNELDAIVAYIESLADG
ncbi:MAG: c-type cytochrome [Acidimicrobiia bacterium]